MRLRKKEVCGKVRRSDEKKRKKRKNQKNKNGCLEERQDKVEIPREHKLKDRVLLLGKVTVAVAVVAAAAAATAAKQEEQKLSSGSCVVRYV